MLSANFFHKIFKYKNNRSNKIIKYGSNRKFDLEDQISHQIIEIDEQISENSKALFEAQIVKLRSNLSKSNNFIEKIGKNVYKTKLEDSINWHQKQLKSLYSRRRVLQIHLDKIKGVFWINRIKRFLTIIFIGLFILLSLFIFLSGFMIIIYLLPLILLISFGYLLATKKF
tara:strand:- start:197 stop:709 length:513 start_codon:yes stop_codon:yes gene_type:complete